MMLTGGAVLDQAEPSVPRSRRRAPAAAPHESPEAEQCGRRGREDGERARRELRRRPGTLNRPRREPHTRCRGSRTRQDRGDGPVVRAALPDAIPLRAPPRAAGRRRRPAEDPRLRGEHSSLPDLHQVRGLRP